MPSWSSEMPSSFSEQTIDVDSTPRIFARLSVITSRPGLWPSIEDGALARVDDLERLRQRAGALEVEEVRRAGQHDLLGARAVVDAQQRQAIGVRVRHHLEDLGDDDRRRVPGEPLRARARCGRRPAARRSAAPAGARPTYSMSSTSSPANVRRDGQFLGRVGDGDVVAQPGQGNAHASELLQEPQVVRPEVPDVVDRVHQHRDALRAHAEGEAGELAGS